MKRFLFLLTLFLTPSFAMAQQPQWQINLAASGDWMVPLGVFLGPLLSALITAVALIIGFRYLAAVQNKHLKRAQEKEMSLKQREKIVLASSLAGELSGNRVKCESFITIYSEMMRGLRNPELPAQYEETGDMIHQRPALSRSVFDSNVEKLNLFDPQLAGKIADTYANIQGEPEYVKLDPSMSRTGAIRLVEMVLDEAQKALEPLDEIIGALNVVVRDRRI